jgi:hypothetical protein
MDIEQKIAWYQAQLAELKRIEKEAAMAEAPDLNDAVARAMAFLTGWNTGDVIDEESGMTADDLGVILAFVNDFPSSD